MKIKEKGLTGKSADFRRRGILGNPAGRKGFNAFREMNAKDGKGKDGGKKEKPEILLDFMGKRIKVLEEDGEGTINEDEYEAVPNATLKFEGLKGECQWTDIKVSSSLFSGYSLTPCFSTMLTRWLVVRIHCVNISAKHHM